METIRRQYYRFLVLFSVALCALCVAFSLWAISRTEKFHAETTYNQIYEIKKAYMKDTVLNMIRDIDRLRSLFRTHAQDGIERLTIDVNRLYRLSPTRYLELILELLHRAEYQNLNIRLESVDKDLLLYKSGQETPHRADSLYSRDIRFGSYELHLGINEDWVDAQTKTGIASIIHSQVFANNDYLWVNEIHNWNGGDKYAIRRIHPGLPETEGSFLSTETKDLKGNKPFLVELDGVKAFGEIYYAYYFNRKNSDMIAEKLSYATLYPDYDWIIAMGVYLEDVQTYIDAVQKSSHAVSAQVVVVMVALLCVCFVAGLYVLYLLEKWYMRRSSNVYREESNTDPLTGALNRRMGDYYLADAFKRFHRGIDAPIFFSFDIDDFKKVNDSFGHDAGDIALKAIVAQIRAHMRSSDRLFRWGGEEFLLMCYGVEWHDSLTLARKLNDAVSKAPIVIGTTDSPATCNHDIEACAFGVCGVSDDFFNRMCVNVDGQQIIHVSISIGVSWFERSDAGYQDALKRADSALYKAKAEGKNCSRVFEP